MIDFELPPQTKLARNMVHGMSENLFRKLSAKYDSYEHEHEDIPEVNEMAEKIRAATTAMLRGGKKDKGEKEEQPKRPRGIAVTMVVAAEERAWGDAGLALAVPGRGLGNAAIEAVATPEQKERFGEIYAAMAITEPGCGSDSSAVTTTAKLDPETNEWVLNGEKIFVTAGKRCNAVVVWATLDKTRGRPAIKSFVVEKSRPGIRVVKLEDKLGIRASDTASILLEDCRIPYDNILGSPEIKEKEGFKGVMKTFDATRPGIAAMAVGVARASLEFTRERLDEEGISVRYGVPLHRMTALEREIMEMEANLDAARLLVWRAAAMMDDGLRNSLEASMAKAKAGRAATLVTQKCVEILGSLGYSSKWLVEKWMRDCKINDIFEGTGQIQMLIVARNILGYGRDMLK